MNYNQIGAVDRNSLIQRTLELVRNQMSEFANEDKDQMDIWLNMVKEYIEKHPYPSQREDKILRKFLDTHIDREQTPEADFEEIRQRFREFISSREIAFQQLINEKVAKTQKENRELLKDIPLTAETIKMQPGSRWLESPQGSWSPDPREYFRFPLNEIEKPNRKIGQLEEWRIICSQLDEFRKEELIHLVYEMGLMDYIKPYMKKAQICAIIRKFIKPIKEATQLPLYKRTLKS